MKVPDAFLRTKDLALREVIDAVTAILNLGLYQMRVVDSVPTWAANQGETAIYYTGDTRALYFQVNSQWCSIGFNTLGTMILSDADQDTFITPEATADEDILRYYVGGIYKFAMGSVGFAMAAGTPVVFDGIDGNTTWSYNSATAYLQAHVDGTLVMEM